MDDDSDRQQTERPPRKCFICEYVDHLIVKCLKPPKDNNKQQKKVRFIERVNCISQKESKDDDDDNDQYIYAFMARMSMNDKSSSKYFGNSLLFSNWTLDSVATCHMTPQVSCFIPVLLEDTDKYIEFAGGNYVTAKQKVQVQIKMCDDNGYTFIMTLHILLLAKDLCNRLFLIITLMKLGHTCLFHKGFCIL